VAIADQSGNLLWSVDPDVPLVPASAVKVLTTGFARSRLGGSARQATRVLGHGYLDSRSGEWVGNWTLELNGDPTLDSSQDGAPTLYDLAGQLRASGVRSIRGPFRLTSAVGQPEASYPAAWSPRHQGRLFAPLIGAVTVNENVVAVTIKPGPRSGAPAEVAWERPRGVGSLVRIEARTVSGRRARLQIRAVPGGGWVVSGTIGNRARAKYLAVPSTDPRVVVEAVWTSALAWAGIEWNRGMSGPTIEGLPRVLAEVRSTTLDSMASAINRRSNNLGAELLLRWAAADGDGPSQLTKHVERVSGRSGGALLRDGSGLSYYDRVAPSTFTSYMARIPTTAAGRGFAQLLPAAGSGTLRGLQRGLPERGVVRAKTGTLRRVSTIVGYLGRPDGVMTISLMYNGPRPNTARRYQWQLFRTLGANGVVVPEDLGPTDPVQLGSDLPGSEGELPAPPDREARTQDWQARR